jgi:hypothetical protein
MRETTGWASRGGAIGSEKRGKERVAADELLGGSSTSTETTDCSQSELLI